MNEVRIIIFAKAPVPGRVKTRLIPELGREGSSRLARDMLQRTVREAKAANIGAVELCGDPYPTEPAWDETIEPTGLRLSEQGNGDLGERLARGAQRTIRAGAWPLLIGTDCPVLDRHRLRVLAAGLQRHDVVIQPAQDGGYVALGLARYDPALFEGIAWSTDTVAGETMRRVAELGWSLLVGETLRDIDTFEDLKASGLAH